MAFRFFVPEATARNAPPPANFLIGSSNSSDNTTVEKGITLSWTVNPRLTWWDYNCWIECYLDSGIALHKPLPQKDDTIDTPASQLVSPIDANAPANKNGVNLISRGSFTDVVQRMASSTYRFALKGYGVRAGYQIPIPGIKTVAGVPAIFERSGACYNRIIGNLSGIPLWYATWELWYVVTIPPTEAQEPPPNFAEAIRGEQDLPAAIQVPFSAGDYNAVPGAPPGGNLGFIPGVTQG